MSVGTALSEARESAGLSVDEVAARTRIRRTLVENIEHDDFDGCGGDFYARGHIRSIAHVVGIDPEPLVREFDGDHPRPADLPTASGVLVAERSGDSTISRPNWSAAMALALVAVLGIGGYQVLQSAGDADDGGTSVSASTETATTPDDGATAPDDGAAADTDTGDTSTDPRWEDLADDDAIAQAPSGVEVTLSTPDGRSWVSATTADGTVLYEGLPESGDEKTVTDDEQVDLVAGNAGALHLTVNGEDLGTPGGNGEVVRMSFGPDDAGGSSA